jgi:hypothetical protein
MTGRGSASGPATTLAVAQEQSRQIRLAERERKYGLDPGQYRLMEQTSDGHCWICWQPAPSGTLVIDHCHSTGRVRGLLCQRCNMALGHYGDNAELLTRMADYLRAREPLPVPGVSARPRKLSAPTWPREPTDEDRHRLEAAAECIRQATVALRQAEVAVHAAEAAWRLAIRKDLADGVPTKTVARLAGGISVSRVYQIRDGRRTGPTPTREDTP